MTTHISYETARKLKAFLGESAPEPMGLKDPWIRCVGYDRKDRSKSDVDCYSYRVEDIISKPFCEAMAKKGCTIKVMYNPVHKMDPVEVYFVVSKSYYVGGLPAVEKALCEMMEGK